MRLRLASILLLMPTLAVLAAEPLALRPGEKFTYKVSWAVLPGAGEIKIEAKGEPAFAEPRLSVVTTTMTRGIARMFFSFEARAESLFNATTGLIVSLREWSKQEDKLKEHTVIFDHAKHEARYSLPDASVAPRTLPMPAGDPMDLITSLVQTRAWNLKPGEKRDALVLFNDDFYELTIHATRFEEVRTALGKFNALVLEPRMEKTAPKGMFKRGSSARVWISQDERRLPVKFEVEFKVGTGVATLTHYEPPSSAKATEGRPSAGAAASKPTDAKNPRP